MDSHGVVGAVPHHSHQSLADLGGLHLEVWRSRCAPRTELPYTYDGRLHSDGHRFFCFDPPPPPPITRRKGKENAYESFIPRAFMDATPPSWHFDIVDASADGPAPPGVQGLLDQEISKIFLWQPKPANAILPGMVSRRASLD